MVIPRILILLFLTVCLVSTVSATTWVSSGGCWTAIVDGYNVTMWNATGNSSWTVPTGVTSAWVFVVGGGGAGGGGVGADGNNWGGGGGGGAVLNGTMSLTPGSVINITVGSGGGTGNNGKFSVFNNAVAPGGGAGKGTGGASSNGLQGGSGGGGGGFSGGLAGASNATTSGGLTAFGNRGGYGFADGDPAPYGGAGGGGGAGGMGMNGSTGVTGNGGLCIASNITGVLSNFSAGGGGNTYTLKGLGGCPDTGGNSSADTALPDTEDGVNGTGSGGGGAGTWGSNRQSSGGSGVVIIRYLAEVSPPVSNFTANVTTGINNLTVKFNDTSTGSPTSWSWTFRNVTGNNTRVQFSTAQNVTYTFTEGNWSIILNATNAGGMDSSDITFINISAFAAPPTPTATPTPVISLPSTVVSNHTLHLSAEVGENYVQWSWRSVNSSDGVPLLDIYLDDNKTPIITNYTAKTYLQTKINPDERHNIALYNTTSRMEGNITQLAKGTITTLKPAYVVYILLVVVIALLVLCFMFGEPMRLIMMTVLNILLCIFGVMISVGRGAIPYLFIGIGIITGIILLVNGLPKLREEISWW